MCPPVVPFFPCLGEGSPTEIDYRKKGGLILPSLLEDLGDVSMFLTSAWKMVPLSEGRLHRGHHACPSAGMLTNLPVGTFAALAEATIWVCHAQELVSMCRRSSHESM